MILQLESNFASSVPLAFTLQQSCTDAKEPGHKTQRKHTKPLSMKCCCPGLRWGSVWTWTTGSWLVSWVWKKNCVLCQLPSWIMHSSTSTFGSSSELALNTCPFQPLKLTDVFWPPASLNPHIGVFRQWTVILWVASELSKWRKFICTFPMPNSSFVTDGGVKHVWPPAVKLQKTSMASEGQPMLGSIQYFPSDTLRSQLSKSLQMRAGLSRVPRGFLMLCSKLLR